MNHIEAHLLCNPSPAAVADTRGMLQFPQKASSAENGRPQTRHCAAKSGFGCPGLEYDAAKGEAASAAGVLGGSLCSRALTKVFEDGVEVKCSRSSTSVSKFAISLQVRTSHSCRALASPQRTSIRPAVCSER